MAFESKTKDPDAVLDYTWPWAEHGWLTDGDTITDAAFTVYAADSSDMPIDIPDSDTTPVVVDSSSATDTDATAWLSGGTRGLKYLITCRITTSGGRIDDRTLKLKITER